MLGDSLLYVAAKIVPGALGIGATSLLTRHYRPADYGAYGAALVVMTFGSSMVFDWIGLAFMRLYERRRDEPAAIPTFIALFLIVLAAVIAIAGVMWATGARGVWLGGIAMMAAASLFELLARFEIADFRPRRYLAMNVGRGVLMLAAAAGAARLDWGPVRLTAATAVALAASCLLARRRPLLPAPRLFDRALAAEAIRFGLPYAASMTLLSLATTGTRAVVGAMSGTDALDLYTAGFAVSQNVLILVAAGIGSATYPAAVRAVETGDPARALRQLEANATLLLALLAPASLGLALVAHPLASLLVGPAYARTVAALIPWLAAAGFLGGMRACYLDHAFQLGHRPGLQIRVAVLAGIVAVGGTAVLTPRVGALGAAVASAVAMAVACAHAAWLGRRAFRLPVPWRGGTLVLVGCAALTVAVRLARADGLAPQIATGMVFYGLVMLAGTRGRTVSPAKRAISPRFARRSPDC
jgi:O-antigen/teichoic acid export membrane protein